MTAMPQPVDISTQSGPVGQVYTVVGSTCMDVQPQARVMTAVCGAEIDVSVVPSISSMNTAGG